MLRKIRLFTIVMCLSLKYFFTFLGTCLIWLTQVNAQTFLVSGQVVDAVSGEPLVSATIQSGTQGTLTDHSGHFNLELPIGNHEIVCRYLGFLTFRQKITLDSSLLGLIIQLEPEANLLQIVTITSGKYEKPLSETTVSLEVVMPQFLDINNATSIDKVLGKIPGVDIIDGQPNIRGGSGFSYGAGSRVLLVMDDIPALQADAGYPLWDDFPVENISQIEIVKGASSALYGSSALNGVINVRTAYATETPRTKFTAFYGNYMDPRDKVKKWWDSAPFEMGASFSDARRVGKWDFVTGAFYMNRESYERHNFANYGRLTGKIRFKPKEHFEFGVNTNFNKGRNQFFFFWRNAEEGAYESDSINYTLTDRVRYTIDPFIRWSNDNGDKHELKGRIYHINNEVSNDRSNFSDLYYLEYQYQKQVKPLKLVVNAGVVGIHSKVEAVLYGDTTYHSNNLAGYIQLDKRFGKKIIVNLGSRFEYNSLKSPGVIGNVVVPEENVTEAKPVFRFGVNYQLAEQTYLRGSWGQGYRYPTIAEKFVTTQVGPTMVTPNPELKSETGWSAEIGIKRGFKVSAFRGYADVSLFWMEYDNMMEFIFTGLRRGFQSQNIGDTRIKGLDISINGTGRLFSFPSTIIAGYTFLDPRFRNFSEEIALRSSADGNILKYRSKHQFKIDWQTGYGRVDLGISFLYTSKQEAIDAIWELVIPGLMEFRETHQHYTLWDFRAKYALSDQFSASLIVKNALNAEYSVRPGLLQAPRNISVRLDLYI